MEIKVIESGKRKAVIELTGEDHTFANVLRSSLWESKDVDSSAYTIEHPLKGNPKLLVKMKKSSSQSTKDALKEAADRLKRRAKDFGKKFADASGKKE